jgi:long-subunit acyl-CoA synthetase (AMP-forming)
MKVNPDEIQKRIIIAGHPASPVDPKLKQWKRYDDLLGRGQLVKEEPFDGPDCHETALICYSSGTTSSPKGVEVCIPLVFFSLSLYDLAADKTV